jgi:hypothetical protein
MPTDFNYENLKPLDVVCTAASSLTGRLIRLYTARLKGKSGPKEFLRQEIANHCAIIIKMDGKLWLAEMVDDGLKINSMRVYLNNKNEKIVAIKRNNAMDASGCNLAMNETLIGMCQNIIQYDYNMILQYLGVGKNDSAKYYCSELCEVIANMCNTSWDNWQLKKSSSKARMISPVEIHLGDITRSQFVENYYV